MSTKLEDLSEKVLNIDELNQYMSQFICDKGLWTSFVEFLKIKGYADEEIESIEDL